MNVTLVHYLRLMNKFKIRFKHDEYLQVLGHWHGRQINAYDKKGKYYVKNLKDYYDIDKELALITGNETPKEEKYDRELIELMAKANQTAGK